MNQGEASMNLLGVGIMESIYSVCMMRSEENALLYHPVDSNEGDICVGEVENEICQEESKGGELPLEMTFMELQYGFEAIAVQLHYRFGVRPHHNVLVACEGNAPAELLACTACLRLGAPFVPLPPLAPLPLGNGEDPDTWAALLRDTQPVAAVVTASSEESPLAVALRTRGVHRLLLLLPDGSLAPSGGGSEWTATLPDISDIPIPAAPSAPTSSPGQDVVSSEESAVPLLCVIFTSGSSSGGVAPKGVRGTQEGLLSRLAWQFRRIPFHFPASPWTAEGAAVTEGGGSIVCRRTPLHFVDSLVELFGPLLGGVPQYAPPSAVLLRGDVLGLAELAGRVGVTRCTLLPSQLDLLCALLRRRHRCSSSLDSGPREALWPALQWMFVSGEECARSVVESFQDAVGRSSNSSGSSGSSGRSGGCGESLLGSPSSRLFNLYGSTEVAGDVCCADLTERSLEGAVPIGAEIMSGHVFYVVRKRERVEGSRTAGGEGAERELELVQEGEEGELLIGGVQVCRGYTGSSAGGSGKFVQNPFEDKGTPDSIMSAKVARGGYCGGAAEDSFVLPNTLFCTGDIVRVEQKGRSKALFFVRRNDEESQTVFKIRGGLRVCVAREEHVLADQLVCLALASQGGKKEQAVVELMGGHFRSVMVVVASQSSSAPEGDSQSRNVLVACVHSTVLKDILVDATSGMIASSPGGGSVKSLYDFMLDSSPLSGEETGGETGHLCGHFHPSHIFALTATLRQALPSLSPALASLPALFFPVESFALSSAREGGTKVSRHSFQEQVQQWVHRLHHGRGEKRMRDEDSSSDQRQSYKNDEARRQLIADSLLKVLPFSNQEVLVAAASASPPSALSFFALGGDSMSAVEAVWVVQSALVSTLGACSEQQQAALSSLVRGLLSEPVHILVDRVLEHLHRLEDETDENKGIGVIALHPSEQRTVKRSRPLPSPATRAVPLSLGSGGEPVAHWFGKAGASSLSPLIARAITAQDEHRKSHSTYSIRFSQLWRCAFSKCIDGTPLAVLPSPADSQGAVGGGRLYVGSHNGEIACMDMKSGEKVWKQCVGTEHHIEGAMCFDSSLTCVPLRGPGADLLPAPASAPTGYHERRAAVGVVFAASYVGQDVDEPTGVQHDSTDAASSCVGCVWALCASSGDLLWHSGGVIAGEVKGSPVIVHLTAKTDRQENGMSVPAVVVGSHDGSVYVFDALSGSLLGSLDLQRGAIFASPVPHSCGSLMEGCSLLVATTAGWVVSVTLTLALDQTAAATTGEVLLELSWSRRTANSAPVFSSPVIAPCPSSSSSPDSPRVLLAVCCSVGGECLCVKADSGDEVWSVHVSSPLGSDSSRGRAGEKRSPIFSSPCVFPLILRVPVVADKASPIGVNEHSLIRDVGLMFGSHDGSLRCISLHLGRLLWSVSLQAAIFSSPTVVSVPVPRTDKPSSPDPAGGVQGASALVAIVATTAGELFALAVPGLYNGDGDGDGEACGATILDRWTLPGEVYSSPVAIPSGAGPPAASSFVAVGCRDDSVYAFRLDSA